MDKAVGCDHTWEIASMVYDESYEQYRVEMFCCFCGFDGWGYIERTDDL